MFASFSPSALIKLDWTMGHSPVYWAGTYAFSPGWEEALRLIFRVNGQGIG